MREEKTQHFCLHSIEWRMSAKFTSFAKLWRKFPCELNSAFIKSAHVCHHFYRIQKVSVCAIPEINIGRCKARGGTVSKQKYKKACTPKHYSHESVDVGSVNLLIYLEATLPLHSPFAKMWSHQA